MQLCRGQTPDSRSPLQHYCVFKPLRPCGNSQFDEADLQCWQATVTISFSQTKRDAVYNAFSWENPLIFMVTRRVAETKLEEEKKSARRLLLVCKTFCYCRNQKIFQPSSNRYDSSWILCNLLLQVWGLADLQKTLISVELWDHCCDWEHRQNRCTQGALLFTRPTALAWETMYCDNMD